MYALGGEGERDKQTPVIGEEDKEKTKQTSLMRGKNERERKTATIDRRRKTNRVYLREKSDKQTPLMEIMV